MTRGGATVPLSKLSDLRISNEMADIEKRMESLADVMYKYADESVAYLGGAPWGSESGHKAYVKARDEHQLLNARRVELLMEQVRRNEKKVKPATTVKRFVNGYGEATDRYVTSTSYERAMRRTEREIQSRMKGFR